MENYVLTLTPKPPPPRGGLNFHWRGGAEPSSPIYLVKAAELGISVFVEASGDAEGDPLELVLVAPDYLAALTYARWAEAYFYADAELTQA